MKHECFAEEKAIMADHGYFEMEKQLGEEVYDEDHEKIFQNRRMKQMESIFSKEHKDTMLSEIRWTRFERHLEFRDKLSSFHKDLQNPKYDYFDKVRFI